MTEDQARAFITDPGTLKRGLELASPAQWGNLGSTDTAAWGECKGSGSKPYQTGIDLTEPAFKCSCPSRVFPCKHGAGLLLLMARQPELLGGSTVPAWLEDWLGKRQQTQEKKATKPPKPAPTDETAAAEPDAGNEAARQKRETQRLTRMLQGAAELEAWLLDAVRAGLAAAKNQPRSYWEMPAARLVDYQLPGLATAVRALPGLCHSGPDWPERLLAGLGELYVLVRAFRRLDAQPAAAREELLQQVGLAVKKEDLLARQPAVADEWQVLGMHTEEEDRLTARRAWLWSRATGRYALLLEYAFGNQPFVTPLVPGAVYAGELVFFPSLRELRAVPAGALTRTATPATAPPGQSLTQLFDAHAAALAAHPWLRQWPATLSAVLPTPLPDGSWLLHHAAEPLAVPLRTGPDAGWELLALSGGQPLTLFGEWDGRAFRPLSRWLPETAEAPVAEAFTTTSL